MADGANDRAAFEASIFEVPQDEGSRDSHPRSETSLPSLVVSGEGAARASRHARPAFHDLGMPPVDRPVFDLPLPASRWRWRG